MKMRHGLALVCLSLLFTLLPVTGTDEMKICSIQTPCTCGSHVQGDKFLSNADQLRCSNSTALYLSQDDTEFTCNGKSIVGEGRPQHAGVQVYGDNVTIRDCTISGFYTGISIHGDNVVVENSTITNNFATAISVYGNDTIIRGNRATNNWDGVFVVNATGTRVVNNTLTNNTIDGVHLFKGAHEAYVADNDLRFNDGHAIAPVHCDHTIKGRSNIGANGTPVSFIAHEEQISIDGGDYGELILCNVTGGTIRNLKMSNGEMKSDGVLVVRSSGLHITENRFVNTRAGVYLYAANGNRMSDNVFANSDYGVRFMAGSSGNQLEGNIFLGNTYPIWANESLNEIQGTNQIGKREYTIMSLRSGGFERTYQGVEVRGDMDVRDTAASKQTAHHWWSILLALLLVPVIIGGGVGIYFWLDRKQ